jgi:hypothetical protein
MSKRGEVSADEAKNFKVARAIHGRYGFVIPDIGDMSEDSWVRIYQGAPHSFFWIRWVKLIMVANLHLEKPDNWVMNVYGRAFFEDECRKLAEELAAEFKVHVHLKLIQERVGYIQPSYD